MSNPGLCVECRNRKQVDGDWICGVDGESVTSITHCRHPGKFNAWFRFKSTLIKSTLIKSYMDYAASQKSK